jgi:hypothetical protein
MFQSSVRSPVVDAPTGAEHHRTNQNITLTIEVQSRAATSGAAEDQRRNQSRSLTPFAKVSRSASDSRAFGAASTYPPGRFLFPNQEVLRAEGQKTVAGPSPPLVLRCSSGRGPAGVPGKPLQWSWNCAVFARQLAFICLLNVGAFAASSEPAFERSNDLFIYLHHQADFPANVSDAMWQETAELMRPTGYHVRQLDTPHQVHAAFLVVVELEGRCSAETPATIPATQRRLASAVIENGRILPIVKVSCTALQQFLASRLNSKPDAQFLFGRALGRLLAHELYHVAGETTQHTQIGVTQAAVSASELISAQFTFCRAAVEKLRPSPAYGNKDSGNGQ